ncbi:HpcH/HpaI aldolase/citrate lyase family protein [Piscinibacter sakaiensis]|uniref:HpcH/HpaI aldolase/citrate lyase family protein n=1 Tax=Piscinibacter sakaiensis TaxID=1547922 RepID=UPI003AB02004
MTATRISPRRERLQRSELAVPASSPRFFEKAARCDADVIFLDLEDAVAVRMKDEARRAAIDALNQVDWGHRTMAVRVNGLDTAWALADIVEIARHCPRLDMILLPKAGSAFDVQFVDHLLTLVEREQRREQRIGLEALIETAQGVAHAEEIAAASDRLEAMIFGIGDYTVDMRTFDPVFGTPSERYAVLTTAQPGGARERHWNDQWHFAMARVVNACRAWGLRAIDGPFTDFGDADGYRASAERAAALGYDGKWAIHPSQIAMANKVFSPNAQQVGWADRVLAALDAAAERGAGALNDNGVLVDLAHGKQAQQIRRRVALIESRGR